MGVAPGSLEVPISQLAMGYVVGKRGGGKGADRWGDYGGRHRDSRGRLLRHPLALLEVLAASRQVSVVPVTSRVKREALPPEGQRCLVLQGPRARARHGETTR